LSNYYFPVAIWMMAALGTIAMGIHLLKIGATKQADAEDEQITAKELPKNVLLKLWSGSGETPQSREATRRGRMQVIFGISLFIAAIVFAGVYIM
jgi:hypothetical protein